MDIQELRSLIEKRINSLGYDLVECNYVHSNGQDLLNIVVDKFEEIDMNMIVELSHDLNSYLDELNPYDNPYTLDISSLGAEKPLKVEKLESYVGKYINVHLVNPIKGENIYEGTLEEVNDDKIIISYRQKTRSNKLEILKTNIYKIRLAIKF